MPKRLPAIGNTIKFPVQQTTVAKLKTRAAFFEGKHGSKPTKLIIHFEVDLKGLLPNEYYAIGYLKGGTASDPKYVRIDFPHTAAPKVALHPNGGKLGLGNIEVSLGKFKSYAVHGVINLTPVIYTGNAHVAYSANGTQLNPSPPAAPN
jgi:hypothetical protein